MSRCLCLVFFPLIALPIAGHATSVEHFMDLWLEAVRHEDAAAYRQLIHPASLACLTGDKAEFLERHIAAKISAASVEPASLTVVAFPPSLPHAGSPFQYAVTPTHLITVQIGATSIGLGVARLQSSWREVLPCVSANGIVQLQKQWAIEDRKSKRKTPVSLSR